MSQEEVAQPEETPEGGEEGGGEPIEEKTEAAEEKIEATEEKIEATEEKTEATEEKIEAPEEKAEEGGGEKTEEGGEKTEEGGGEKTEEGEEKKEEEVVRATPSSRIVKKKKKKPKVEGEEGAEGEEEEEEEDEEEDGEKTPPRPDDDPPPPPKLEFIEPEPEVEPEPELKQFADAKSDHKGEYIKKSTVRIAASASRPGVTPSRAALAASKSRLVVSPSRAALAASKSRLAIAASKSRLAVSPSKAKATASKAELAPSPSVTKKDTSISALEGEVEVAVSERPSTDASRASSRVLTSQDRIMSMTDDWKKGRKGSDRRSSIRARGLSGSIISFRRQSGDAERARVPRMQNTYRMESKRPFNADRVQVILREVLEKECENERYDQTKVNKFAMTLCGEIRNRVKLQNFDRYKLAIYVSICEKQQQSIHTVVKFLWDAERDNYSFYAYENQTMFVVGCVYGTYYE